MRTAFVAGATGYTGREVVRACLDAGLAVVAHVRPDSAAHSRWLPRFSELGARVDTTPWTTSAMTETLRELGPALVFALLGTTRVRGREAASGTDESYETVDYGLTITLLEAATACQTRPRFVYLSSTGVGPRARGSYLRARWRVEEALRVSGLEFVIARPSVISGPDRDEARPGERLAAGLIDAALAVVGVVGGHRLRARYRSTTNVALARALVRLALARDAAGLVFESEQLRG